MSDAGSESGGAAEVSFDVDPPAEPILSERYLVRADFGLHLNEALIQKIDFLIVRRDDKLCRREKISPRAYRRTVRPVASREALKAMLPAALEGARYVWGDRYERHFDEVAQLGPAGIEAEHRLAWSAFQNEVNRLITPIDKDSKGLPAELTIEEALCAWYGIKLPKGDGFLEWIERHHHWDERLKDLNRRLDMIRKAQSCGRLAGCVWPRETFAKWAKPQPVAMSKALGQYAKDAGPRPGYKYATGEWEAFLDARTARAERDRLHKEKLELYAELKRCRAALNEHSKRSPLLADIALAVGLLVWTGDERVKSPAVDPAPKSIQDALRSIEAAVSVLEIEAPRAKEYTLSETYLWGCVKRGFARLVDAEGKSFAELGIRPRRSK